jgi:triacylglycerol esterase/lipase EstA (alpha/beta hydrolase family)
VDAITPPPLHLSLSETWRAGIEITELACKVVTLQNAPKGDGHPVMTLPGYGGADGCMALLRYFLTSRGYQSHGWGLGRNIPPNRITSLAEMNSFQMDLLQRLNRQIDTLFESTQQKISLIGWSLGGNYANLLAQSRPDAIRQVITLGTPYGDPRGTSAWKILKCLNRGSQSDESQNTTTWADASNGQREVPTTAIYSPIDGIVSPRIAKLSAKNTENIAVNSSHIGFTANAKVYRIIAEVLARPNPQLKYGSEFHT